MAQSERQSDADSWRALTLHARERQSNYGQERMKAARKHRERLLRNEGKARDANKALELATDLLQVHGAQRRWHARSAALFLPWAARETRDENVSYDPLQTAIRTCLHEMIGTDDPKVASAFRGALDKIVTQHGTPALANIAENAQSILYARHESRGRFRNLLNDWILKTNCALRQLAIEPKLWRTVLNSIEHAEKNEELYDDKNGFIRWSRAEGSPGAILNTNGTLWNGNGIRRRLADGSLAKLVNNCDSDFIFFGETKAAPYKLARPWELRRALAHKGYHHCYWNWSPTDPGNWGCAFFSKIKPLSVRTGLNDDTVDEQGRTITLRFTNATLIAHYNKCSDINAERDETRVAWDAALSRHVSAERGLQPNTFLIGDLNVAPKPRDAQVGPNDGTFPSTRSHEREDFQRLLDTNAMEDAQGALDKAPLPTWSSGGRQGLRTATGEPYTMRLDLAVAPRSRIGRGEPDGGPRVASVVRNPDKHRSDHWPVHIYFREDGRHLAKMTEGGNEEKEDNVLVTPNRPQKKPADEHEDFPMLNALCADDKRQTHISTAVWEAILKLSEHAEGALHEEFIEQPATLPGFDLEHADMAKAEGQPNGSAGIARLDAETILGPGGKRCHVALPRKHKVMPTLPLPMGIHGSVRMIKLLFDSGATPSAMSFELARSLGVRIEYNGNLQKVYLADGTPARPTYQAKVPVALTEHMNILVTFILLEHLPTPIVGSTAMDSYKGGIDYEKAEVYFNVDGERISLPWRETARSQTPFSTAAGLYAQTDVEVAANTSKQISACMTEETRNSMNGQWAWISDAKAQPLLVRNGYTKIHAASSTETKFYRCAVHNPYPWAVTIKANTPIASLEAFDPDEEFKAAVFLDDPPEQGDDKNTAASMSHEQPQSLSHEEIDTLWDSKPELKDLKLEHIERQCNENGSQDLLYKFKTDIIRLSRLWKHEPKERKSDAVECHITMPADHKPWFHRSRAMNPHQREELSTALKYQLDKRIIEPSDSPYSSAVMMVPKAGGKLRFVVDLRPLNKQVQSDGYTLPRVDEALTSMQGANFVSGLDLRDAFWSCNLTPESRKYTAFQTHMGHFQYRVMPQGYKNASAVFCRFVDQAIGDMKWIDVLTYIDDLMVFSTTLEEHISKLTKLFERLDAAGLTLNPAKCNLMADNIPFLGHVVDKHGVRPDPKKVAAIEAIQLPQDAATLKSALGQFAYYRQYIRNYSKITHSLRKKQDDPTKWKKDKATKQVPYTGEETKAFYAVRDMLKAQPILRHPNWELPFQVHTDASERGLGATLVQKDGAKEHVIAYASRVLTKPEKNYHTWEQEALAVLWALRHFRMYLYGKPFTVLTDNDAVRQVLQSTSSVQGGRLLRWRLALQEFDFTVDHRPGKRHGDADGPSRMPIQNEDPYDDGPTNITPAPALNYLMKLKENDTGDAAFFPPSDDEAHDIQQFKMYQATDKNCQRIMEKYAGKTRTDAKPGECFIDEKTGLLICKDATNEHDRIYVPLCLRAFILRRHHGLPVTGHPGRRRTYALIQRNYIWKGLKRDVTRWLRACRACAIRKTPRPMKHGEPGIVSDKPYPWHTLGIDLVEATATTSHGNRYILTCTCLFGRWAIAVPLPDKKAKTVGTAVFNHILAKFGPPKQFLSDCGSEFINAGFKYMCDRWGIKRFTTGGYQSQALPTERWHRWLNSAMTTLANHFGQGWDDYLQAVVFNYNISTCDATGYSPYELMFGRSCSLLQELNLVETQPPQGPADTHTWEDTLARRLQRSYEFVRTQQEHMATRNQKRNSKNAKHVKFEKDELVLLWEPRQSKTWNNKANQNDDEEPEISNTPMKWRPRWTGPHKIEKAIAETKGRHYQIQHTKRGSFKAHVNKLIKFNPWSETITSTSAWLDGNRGFCQGEWANEGSLIIVPLLEPHPFGIGRITKTNPNGQVQYQWLGNDRNNVRQALKPGWMTKKGNKIYYSETKRAADHIPYNGHTDVPIHQRDIVLHNFELTKTGMLPKHVLRAISNNPEVWWKDPRFITNVVPTTMPTIEEEEEPQTTTRKSKRTHLKVLRERKRHRPNSQI